MKTALCGVWHVHASQYLKEALKTGEVCGVYDADAGRRRAFCEKHGVPEFETLDALLGCSAEGVIVCTATNEHIGVIPKIAEAGKNIFTEKVLALSADDCRIIAESVRRNKVGFTISFPHKYGRGPMTVKAVADSGELGKINYVRVRNCHDGSVGGWLPPHFYDPVECGGGAMIDLGAHGMYLIDWLLGLPEKYYSAFTHCFGREVEDNAVTVMSYPDGAIAVNETGFVSSCYPLTFEVGGERGFLRFVADKSGGSVVKSTKDSGGEVAVELLPAVDPPIVQFLKGERLPGCGLDEAYNLTVMMQGAYANIK